MATPGNLGTSNGREHFMVIEWMGIWYKQQGDMNLPVRGPRGTAKTSPKWGYHLISLANTLDILGSQRMKSSWMMDVSFANHLEGVWLCWATQPSFLTPCYPKPCKAPSNYVKIVTLTSIYINGTSPFNQPWVDHFLDFQPKIWEMLDFFW